MYIEFAGLPGSGKSTLSYALKKHLAKMPIEMLSRDEAITQCIRKRDDGLFKNLLKNFPARIWLPFMGSQYALSEFVKLSSTHLEFITFISKILSQSNMDQWLIESIWKTFIQSFSEVYLISRYIVDRSKIIIMDEAFSQRCFTLFGYIEDKIPDDFIIKYSNLAPISNHTFLIVTRPQICIDRIKLRYLNRTSPYDVNSKKLLYSFESGNNILHKLGETLKKQGKFVHRINGDGNINESIKKLCSTASKILSKNIQI